MFIRVKRISGKEYAYAVENSWVKGRSRQKVKKYLGPVIRAEFSEETKPFEQWKNVPLENYIDNTPSKHIIQDLIRHTAQRCGFTGEPPKKDNIVIDLKGDVVRGKKSIVLAIGEGFLCKDTLKTILNVKPIDEERRGEHLAETFLRAGIRLDKRVFILLYRKINNI